jgi:hypothetical protein
MITLQKFVSEEFVEYLSRELEVELETGVEGEDGAKHYFFGENIDLQVELIKEKLFIYLNDDFSNKVQIENSEEELISNIKNAIKKLK